MPESAAPSPHHPATDRRMTLRVATLPRDTNHYGTIFGGVLLSYIDQAAAIAARDHGRHRWVTASFDRVDFKSPVHVGDVINLFTSTVRLGTKSVTIQVEVEAERFSQHACVAVTSATVTMVAIDAQGNPIPFRSPPTVGE